MTTQEQKIREKRNSDGSWEATVFGGGGGGGNIVITQEQKIRYLKKFPLTGDEEQADWWITQRKEELKELVGMIKSYDRFKCVACENKVSKLSHTQFCIFRDEILSLINNKLK